MVGHLPLEEIIGVRVPDRQHDSTVLPMHTPCPAAGATFAGSEVLTEDSDSAIPRLELLCGLYPAEPFVAGKWCQILPYGMNPMLLHEYLVEICRYGMYDA
jgi:hypothetical protein